MLLYCSSAYAQVCAYLAPDRQVASCDIGDRSWAGPSEGSCVGRALQARTYAGSPERHSPARPHSVSRLPVRIIRPVSCSPPGDAGLRERAWTIRSGDALMAGRPRERLMVLELEQRTRAHFEDNDHTVLDYLCAWHADGRTLVRLAREISNKLDLELPAEKISAWVYRTFDRAEAVARLTQAREEGAHVMVARAIDDAEELDDKDDAPVVRVRNDARLWAAQRYNRRELGEQKAGVQINLNVGSLHLDAMRQRSVEAGHAGPALGSADARSLVCHTDTGTSPAIASAIDAEYTVLSGEDSST